VRDGDVVLIFSDGFHDNVFDSGMAYCVEEYIYDGLITSLSQAADCLARKAYFLGKSTSFRSPWMREYKWYTENNIPLMNPPPKDFKFIGGKQDDITMTVAQVFKGGPDDTRRQLAANDKYFTEAKKLYDGPVYSNANEGFKRAHFRINDIPEGVSPKLEVEETRQRVNKMLEEQRAA